MIYVIIAVILLIVLFGTILLILNKIHRHDILNDICMGWTEEEIDAIPTNRICQTVQNIKELTAIAKIQERNEDGCM